MGKKVKGGTTVKSKKKLAQARAIIKKGIGKITINNRNIEIFEPKYIRAFIKEPLNLAGDIAKGYNIAVKVHGGGAVAQAVSARTAIAKALIKATHDEKLKRQFLSYDRMLLVDDPRRKEAKKPLGTGARKKRQTSYR